MLRQAGQLDGRIVAHDAIHRVDQVAFAGLVNDDNFFRKRNAIKVPLVLRIEYPFHFGHAISGKPGRKW